MNEWGEEQGAIILNNQDSLRKRAEELTSTSQNQLSWVGCVLSYRYFIYKTKEWLPPNTVSVIFYPM